MKIFISGNVPSLKNSKQIIQIPVKGRPGVKRPLLMPSKTHKKYVKERGHEWQELAQVFRDAVKDLPKPLRVSFKFIRDSRRKFDYTSALDTCQDLMVDYGWIPDDNCDELLPILEEYEYNKEGSGVWITV